MGRCSRALCSTRAWAASSSRSSPQGSPLEMGTARAWHTANWQLVRGRRSEQGGRGMRGGRGRGSRRARALRAHATHAYTRVHLSAHTHIHAHTHAPTFRVCPWECAPPPPVPTNTHMFSYTNTQKHTKTHINTHTHTHARSLTGKHKPSYPTPCAVTLSPPPHQFDAVRDVCHPPSQHRLGQVRGLQPGRLQPHILVGGALLTALGDQLARYLERRGVGDGGGQEGRVMLGLILGSQDMREEGGVWGTAYSP